MQVRDCSLDVGGFYSGNMVVAEAPSGRAGAARSGDVQIAGYDELVGASLPRVFVYDVRLWEIESGFDMILSVSNYTMGG